MRVVLELQDQPSNIRKVTVRHDIVIGRGAECNLRLSAPQVSRRHCFLRIGTDGAFVSDLDSSNGTWLNGQKLTSGKRYRLDDGADLAIGPVRFIIRVLAETGTSPPLRIQVADQQIESDPALASAPLTESAAEDFSATVSADPDAMDFSLEHGGPSADEDDATADYLSTDDLGNSEYFRDDDEEPETVAGVSEVDVVELYAEDDEVELLDDVEDFVESDEDDEILLFEGDDEETGDDSLTDFLKDLN